MIRFGWKRASRCWLGDIWKKNPNIMQVFLRFIIIHRNDSHVVNHTNAREMKCKMLQFWRSTNSRTDMTSLRRWRKKQPLQMLKVTMLTALRRWTEETSFPSVERDGQANWSQCHLVFLSIPKHTTSHMIWRTRKTKSKYLCTVFLHILLSAVFTRVNYGNFNMK